MGKIDLVRQILDILRHEEASAGFHIREQWLADALGVSRSPVRTALKQLEALRVVRSALNQGYFLEIEAASEAFREIALPESETDRIYRLMASERFANLIGDQVSVGALVKRYGVSRAFVLKVLARMQEDGLVEKTAGHGWVFGPALNDEAAYLESYRYRLLIEPAALLEEAFTLAAPSVERLKRSHREMLEGAVFTAPLTRLFDVDAEFHQALAAACGNRFLSQAIGQQTKLRRLSEYEKYAPRERLMDSFAEHLSILEAIERGDRRAAAASMRAHIRKSHENRPDFRKVRVLAHRRLTRR
jgi:DNA-binding GntR family transcriptional regulator